MIQSKQGSFDQHTLIPGPAWNELEIGGDAVSIVETGIRQHDAFVLQSRDQRQEDPVEDIDRISSPTDDLPVIVNQPAQLHAHDPALIGIAFLANLLLAAPFPDGVDQFNAVAVDHGKETGLRQKPIMVPFNQR